MSESVRTAAHGDRRAIAGPDGAAASQKKRHFLQFTTRQLLLLSAVSALLLAIVTPRIHRMFRSWETEEKSRRIEAANQDVIVGIQVNDVSLVQRGLEAGAHPDLMPGQARESLLFTCITKGRLAPMKLLLDFGADVHNGAPLVAAAACDQPPEVRCRMVRFLVAAGADPERKRGNDDAMDIAVHRSDGKLGDLLREFGLPYGPREMAAFDRLDELRQAVGNDPELLTQRFKSHWATKGPADEPTLLAIALYRGYREMSLFLIDAGTPLDTKQHLGRTLLHEAAHGGDAELIRVLIARGLDVNAADEHCQDIPLEFAAGYDKREAVAALIEAGADVNYQESSGRTFLHGAVRGNRVEVVQMLLAAGADPTIADKKGETPLDVARAQNPAMIDLLEQAAARLSKEH
ncbi:MAG TPA: ankyrin repeat domain-containing protein [Pirellulales bacterium]|nr:ankyrin repeat domain-containing protein [Pirellulales bacterium]